MESENSASCETQAPDDIQASEDQSLSNQWFSERFDELLPKIQEEWPDLAKQTIEATQGSLDELIKVIPGLERHDLRTFEDMDIQFHLALHFMSYHIFKQFFLKLRDKISSADIEFKQVLIKIYGLEPLDQEELP